jgi:release factor glutamine methyltransferase
LTRPAPPVAPGAARSWDALLAAAALPRLEARVLLEHASGRRREWLLAHGDEPAPEAAADAFVALARRRAAGEPLAYLTGWREFHGRRFEVTPAVLIPRPETELLAGLALERAAAGARVVDLGTGSGVLAVTLACERPDLRVTGTDRSARALEVARRNAATLAPAAVAAGRLRFEQGDWWQALGAGERFDLAVSNPPYVAAGDPHLGAGDLRHEPRAALTDGADGLQAIRALLDGAAAHLAAGGWLLIEHGWNQGEPVRALFAAARLDAVATHLDDEGRDRVTLGRLSAR